ncbi:NAD(P)H-dependent oxidoreductase [Streptomyces sp. RerS4]|uniref:NADPH-dependent FMN reductase n=1 Tax=Streptomyces sp. RerS4 TaxID=2942449 RepID=UPI00201C7094|nr:NAD(P)H-dependent oxidoreductase [Streptomyces sp. RerS4]UQX05446.1 NAD(P)H-dependent oxidoreductase [Streptomyces sp. RerS4]
MSNEPNEPLRLAVIIGSNREARFGHVVGTWIATEAARRQDLAVDVIDLADHDLPIVLSRDPSPEVAAELAKVSPRLAQADAFVVVTPEYNHSYPASLKNLIDWHYTQWQAKPVGFVSYGGLSGGLRAVEHLRTVFAELHAVTVRDVVSLHMVWDKFDETGAPKDDATQAAAKVLLDQLGWWGDALRRARARVPYSA